MATKTRRVGFGLTWVVLFIVVFSVQAGHQYQLAQRGKWMAEVNKKLDDHTQQLLELAEEIGQLPEAMLKRFKELPR